MHATKLQVGLTHSHTRAHTQVKPKALTGQIPARRSNSGQSLSDFKVGPRIGVHWAKVSN